jgi:hypothetical protein
MVCPILISVSVTPGAWCCYAPAWPIKGSVTASVSIIARRLDISAIAFPLFLGVQHKSCETIRKQRVC